MKYSVVDPDKNERADKLNYLILGLWILDFTVVFCRVVVVGSGIIILDPQHWWNNLFVLSNSRPARQHETLCNEICRAVGGSTHHNDEGVHSSVKSFAQTIAFSWLGHVGTVQMWCILRQKLWCIGMPFVPFGRIAILCKGMVRVTIGSSRLVCIPFKYKEFLYLLSKVFVLNK